MCVKNIKGLITIKKTKIAFLFLLLQLAYWIMLFCFGLCAALLEMPCDRGGIYTFFAIVSVMMIFVWPLYATEINIASLIFQIIALRRQESKIKNIIMMVVTVLYQIVTILLSIRIWDGALNA